jgi:translation initiation factor IF-2
MTEANDKKQETDKAQDDQPKKLTLGGTLSLKGASAAPRNSAPGTVAVEVRRRRSPTSTRGTSDAGGSQGADGLSKEQLEAKARILRNAQEDGAKRTTLPRRTTIEQKKADDEQKKKAETDNDARARELEEMQRIDAEEQKVQRDVQTAAPRVDAEGVPIPQTRFANADENSPGFRERAKKAQEDKPLPRKRELGDRRNARLTVNQALNRDFERDRGPSLAAQKRAREKARMAAKMQLDTKKIVREVIVPETITVGELANRMKEPGKDVVKALMKLGVMATSTQTIDADTAELLIEEFGHTIRRVTDADVEIGIEGIHDNDEQMQPRPPVVTIMGHVDHGKTSLLDAFRKSDVVSGEAGGITQHIGAYQVTMPSGNQITFLDTPGHAAFTEMRARGANVTDIVIIVVSAEDSIMPQTIEAIAHAKAAKVPIIIAVNKIDLPTANPSKVKQDLLQYEIVVEDLGGDIQCVEVSAKQKLNLDKLEDAILLQAEILELKANANREAHGFVIESKVEKGRGSVATVLIDRGTLKIGNIFVAGAEFGKVRGIINDKGKHVKEAFPGQPVEVLGINGTPQAGDPFNVVKDEAKAREIADYRHRKMKEVAAALAIKGRTTMDDILLVREEGKKTTLSVVVKADVHGSVEAIVGSLAKLEEDNAGISVRVLHQGVGGITEGDVVLAQAAGALIIGFNVRANAQARDLAAREIVRVQYYNVIYNVVDDVKAILTGMLDPVIREDYIGQAIVREVFNITKVGKIAGCIVETGFVKRGSKVRLLRDDVVIHEGMLKTLKRFKDEVKEVKEGTECGMAFESYDDLKVGDVIECFDLVEEKREVT